MASQKLFLVAAIMALGLVFSTDMVFGKRYKICGGVRVYGNKWYHLCCRRTLYDYRKELCCGGQRISVDSSARVCCGKKAVFPSSGLCCNGKVIPHNLDSVKCCGSRVCRAKIGDLPRIPTPPQP